MATQPKNRAERRADRNQARQDLVGRRAATGRGKLAGGTTPLALFGEAIIIGIVAFVATIGVVTALPGYSAAIRHLCRHLRGRDDSFHSLLSDFRAGFANKGWVVSVVFALINLVLVFNITYAGFEMLPGNPTFWVLLFTAILVGANLVFLRVASRWQSLDDYRGLNLPDDDASQPHWRRVLEVSLLDFGGRGSGIALLVTAAIMCAVFVWMLTPLVFIVPGLMVLALVTVEHRAGLFPLGVNG